MISDNDLIENGWKNSDTCPFTGRQHWSRDGESFKFYPDKNEALYMSFVPISKQVKDISELNRFYETLS